MIRWHLRARKIKVRVGWAMARGFQRVSARIERRDLDTEGTEFAEKRQRNEKRASRECAARVDEVIVERDMVNGSRVLAICQLFLLNYCIVIRTASADSNGTSGS